MMTMGQRGEKPQEAGREGESFYTTQEIGEAYEKIDETVTHWRLEAKEKPEREGLMASFRKILGGGPPAERFVEKERAVPRLISLSDSTGPIYFEFTEVQDGGTVIKATYSPALKGRIANLKAELPLKIPSTPIGLKCPSCGKSVLKEFSYCPYCATELVKE
jgi:hypothetical protein